MSKIPKIISGILAAILIAVVLYASLPPVWFWIVFEIFAALLVAVGCAGEWWLHHHPAGRKKVEKEEHHNLESRFIAAVVFGVFMELFSLGHAIPEAIRLENDVAVANLEAKLAGTNAAVSYERAAIAEREAGQAIERAANTESNNLVLRTNVLVLERQLGETKTQLANAQAKISERFNESETNFEMLFAPMDLGDESSFVSGLKPMGGIRVEMRAATDFRSLRTAKLLSEIFSAAGWEIINSSNMDIPGISLLPKRRHLTET